jgi:hypothetical protein
LWSRQEDQDDGKRSDGIEEQGNEYGDLDEENIRRHDPEDENVAEGRVEFYPTSY